MPDHHTLNLPGSELRLSWFISGVMAGYDGSFAFFKGDYTDMANGVISAGNFFYLSLPLAISNLNVSIREASDLQVAAW